MISRREIILAITFTENYICFAYFIRKNQEVNSKIPNIFWMSPSRATPSSGSAPTWPDFLP
jgi:hypothetical protein